MLDISIYTFSIGSLTYINFKRKIASTTLKFTTSRLQYYIFTEKSTKH